MNTLALEKEDLELQSREQLLSQTKITERVQLELASARKEAERAQEARSVAMDKAANTAEERDMVAGDLQKSRLQLDSAVRDLDSSERRAQAIHREKLESVSRLRDEIIKERAGVERALHDKELTAVQLRHASEEREMARKELASTMRQNKQLSKEKVEAEMLSEGLKYRMSEVRVGQEQLLSGAPTMSPRYRPTGSRAADLSPRLHDPKPSPRYYA